MKKTLINIIGGLIPYRPWRVRARNILHFGLIKSIRARLAEPKLEFPYKLAIVAIAKNEGAYFREWIEYHRMLGVEKFYIYDNESTDDIKEVLAPYIKSGVVEYKFWPGQKQQLAVYQHAFDTKKFEAKWFAVIDLDEFLVPTEHETITEYLDSLPKDTSQVWAGWVMYGSNGHEKKPAGLVIENFKTRAAKNNFKLPGDMYKTIANPRFTARPGIHRRHMFAGKNVMSNEGPIEGFAIRCNHYHCKSWEEYSKRAPRGSGCGGAAGGIRKYTREAFDICDQNEVDDPIMDKYIAPLKKRLS
ncbi:MAG: glycosyltransferase family 92 protein [Rickettsiales bacterium]|jgi:hypothetical protein|nr:glycosyltransferase family 92 protein [Rickettsiales bacterium]